LGLGLCRRVCLGGDGRWKTYDPKATFNPTDPTGYRGEKIFEQPLIAAQPGTHTIRPLNFSYFDPGARRVLDVLLSSDEYLVDLALEPTRGELYLTDRTLKRPGIRIFQVDEQSFRRVVVVHRYCGEAARLQTRQRDEPAAVDVEVDE